MEAHSAEIGSFHERMHLAAGGRSCGLVAKLTHTHPETTRRYLRGQMPSVEFIAAFADGVGVNLEWLIAGRGLMNRPESQPTVPASILEVVDRSISALEDIRRQLKGVTVASPISGRAAWRGSAPRFESSEATISGTAM